MRCPACGAENPADARRCAACGERTAKKPRRRDTPDEADTPFGKRTDARAATALTAYRYAVLSLIPLAGLVLGPVAIVLAVLAWRQARRDPAVKSGSYAVVALLLGTATLIANGVGLALMVMGLMSAAS
jgi:hypothetical protein